MTVERCINLGNLGCRELRRGGGLKGLLSRFSRVYLGPEFCENLLHAGLAEEAARFQAEGAKVCLLTPLLSETGIGRMDALFRGLLRLWRSGDLARDRLELTINDFGALELFARHGLPFKLGIGRQLLSNVFVLAEHGELKIPNRRSLAFFSGLGIERYEVQTARGALSRGFSRISGAAGRFRLTLHFPYSGLATTRACMIGAPGPGQAGAPRGANCGQECLDCAFEVAHPRLKDKLLIRGNTVFQGSNGDLVLSDAELAELHVDRLLYSTSP